MSVINTNVKSIVAQNALTVNNRAMSKTMEQLSTGKRINSAADDAAGLAISSKMTSQIKGLNQAVRNANDGISLLQTAEGAMVEVTNMMQRMRELAVQSANDTNTTEDRGYLDLEFQQLKEEANRITKNTQWNGMNILDGSFTGNTTNGLFKFQVGANADQTIDHTIGQLAFAAASTGATATIAETTPASATAAEVSTVTFADTDGTSFKAGDVITLKIGDDQLQYKVADTDLGGTAVENATAIATGVQKALTTAQTQEGKFADLTFTDAAGVLTITADNKNAPFTVTKSINSGELASLASLDVTGRGTSNTAIAGLDSALKTVSEARAEIGSVINRLNYAADNLANVSQNTTASRSQIQDTDYAQATTELARTQIISQAATAMLAQANQAPQSVLSLLR